MTQSKPEWQDRAAGVRVVLLDVDGVLTDGGIYVGADGDDVRRFHSRDGLGIRLGQRGGLTFGIVSGRTSRAVARRASELDITEVHQGVRDKPACLASIVSRLAIGEEQVAFVGDDVVDVAVMRRVGWSAAPADASTEARDAADLVTSAGGGRGAVREVVEALLRASGKWREVVEPFIE